ncbi:MAG: hypothetical protein MZV63_40170 [Marinilabiliales bacterium]|nr:hypothetical protein [Marinilabiliales bacterium]
MLSEWTSKGILRSRSWSSHASGFAPEIPHPQPSCRRAFLVIRDLAPGLVRGGYDRLRRSRPGCWRS